MRSLQIELPLAQLLKSRQFAGTVSVTFKPQVVESRAGHATQCLGAQQAEAVARRQPRSTEHA